MLFFFFSIVKNITPGSCIVQQFYYEPLSRSIRAVLACAVLPGSVTAHQHAKCRHACSACPIIFSASTVLQCWVIVDPSTLLFWSINPLTCSHTHLCSHRPPPPHRPLEVEVESPLLVTASITPTLHHHSQVSSMVWKSSVTTQGSYHTVLAQPCVLLVQHTL